MVVYHINSKDIYHRDLKPENFLTKSDSKGRIYLYLSDFGLAKSSISHDDRISTTTGRNNGTISYMAPEIHDAIDKKPAITKQDVWAIGVIAYELCTFSLPFSGFATSALINAILNTPHKPIMHQCYSSELKTLID
jgi:eukaryotic-like serine/threonine-protein kinase